MDKIRYNHWFWNGYAINWLAKKINNFDNYLWHKRYNRSDYYYNRGCSSDGRAGALQASGQEFDSPHLHQRRAEMKQRDEDLSFESGYVHKTQNKKHLPLYTLGAGKHYERRKK